MTCNEADLEKKKLKKDQKKSFGVTFLVKNGAVFPSLFLVVIYIYTCRKTRGRHVNYAPVKCLCFNDSYKCFYNASLYELHLHASIKSQPRYVSDGEQHTEKLTSA